jgi:hypothetical protein
VKSTSKRNYIRILVFILLFAFVIVFNSKSVVIANKDENRPVLEAKMITGSSVQLSWDMTCWDLDCNTYHFTNFKSWELYQKGEFNSTFFLVFTSSEISETSTTITGLKANSGYKFYIKLFWDWSNLNPEIIPTYGKNLTSLVLHVQTLNPGETEIIDNPSVDSPVEPLTDQSLSFFPTIISVLVVIPLSIILLVVLKRRMDKTRKSR